MANTIGSGFNVTAKEAIDVRIIKTKEEMRALTPPQERRLPDIYFCLCADDKKFYIFDINATANEETGKYRPIEDFINFNTEESKSNLEEALVDSIESSEDVKEAIQETVGNITVDGGVIEEDTAVDGGLITE